MQKLSKQSNTNLSSKELKPEDVISSEISSIITKIGNLKRDQGFYDAAHL